MKQVFKLVFIFVALGVLGSCGSSQEQAEKEEYRRKWAAQNRIKQLVVKTFDAKSPYKEFTGIYKQRLVFRAYKDVMTVGHLVFKNGNEYKGSFFNESFSGLGQLKVKGEVFNGIFMDGVLVQRLDIDLGFDFKKMKAEFKGEPIYVQNGIGLDIDHPRYGQVENGEFKGWVTHVFSRSHQYTTEIPIPAEGGKAFLANHTSADIRTPILSDGSFNGCADYLYEDQRVISKIPRGPGWNKNHDGVFFQTRHWINRANQKKDIPEVMLTTDNRMATGARSHRSFTFKDRSLEQDYPLIKDSFLKQATEDTNYSCFSQQDKEQVPEYLAAVKLENHEASEALKAVLKARQEWARKNALSPAEMEKHMREKTNQILEKQYAETANCKKPDYDWGTLKCDGRTIEPAWIKVKDAKPNYLTPTKAGLIPVSPYMRQQGVDKGIKVFNVHPNLGRSATYKCPQCGGRGFLSGTEAHATKFSPTYTYRNGVEIKSTTTMTTYGQRYGGICGRCHGHGMVPAGWAY